MPCTRPPALGETRVVVLIRGLVAALISTQEPPNRTQADPEFVVRRASATPSSPAGWAPTSLWQTGPCVMVAALLCLL